ncbi:MAG: PAS domain-containing protein [Verrucomicrobia bacterium]|nr:PAS domain-containing protein [Verrucomicrobiota bacterium]
MKTPAKPAIPSKKPSAKTDRSDKSDKSDKSAVVAARPFPIVGIGASAGGLEALELFLKNVPAGSGMAFVIVQHLDPTHKGIMAELLQRGTPMKVMQVKDRTHVQPDCVYVIPPNKDLSILHGVLLLLDPVTPRGLRLPIDFFFRSLAEDAQERGLGVILSGMGSDGTLGLKAIKGKAGAIFVQDPATAKFDGMPRSAVDAGLADVVAPVEALPGRIIAYLKHIPSIPDTGLAAEDKSHSAFEKVVLLLRSQTGHDFSLYKKNTVYRRIERRMGIHQIGKIATYVRFLRENPQEAVLLFNELLIGVTSFFRDPEAWEQLQTEVIPALLKSRPPTQPLRIWVPACATGEEAYSMAILFHEALEKLHKPGHLPALQIFATDLDKDAIEKARAAVYPPNIVADVSPERLSRFFVKVERGYQIGKPIRETVVFAQQNVVMDVSFTKLDLVSCRNLLIYLMPELQKSLLSLFHYSLNVGGVLFLGSAESIAADTHLFEPLPGKARLFRRLVSDLQAEPVEFPASFSFARAGVQLPAALPANLQSQAEQLLLQRYSPAAVLVNAQGDIIFINGRTGKYLEPVAGKANWNLFAMAREGLSFILSTAFRQALRQTDPVICRNVMVGTNGGVQTVDLTIQAIAEPKALCGLVMVVFTDVATPPAMAGSAKAPRANQARFAALQQDLAQASHEVQSTREEMRTFEEEAKSAHEEMQSTNEELQSTNEELTTSKEEMQSMNEELQTLNAELQHKMGGLAQLNNDQKNLLESTDIGILFLDAELRVRLFTAGANRMFKLIPGDVGRPITDIVSNLDYPALADDVLEVLRTLAVHEQVATARDGCWFQIRIKPYRTLENRIDGVVVTVMDITEIRRAGEALRKANELLRLAVVVHDAHDAITVQDLEGRIIAWNPGAVRLYGWSEAEALAMNVRDRIPAGLRGAALVKLAKLSRAEILVPYRTLRLTKAGLEVEVSIISTALVNEAGLMYAIATTERGVGKASDPSDMSDPSDPSDPSDMSDLSDPQRKERV